MKTTALLLMLALAGGCTYNYPYSQSTIGAGHPTPSLSGSQYSLVNNCGYRLEVYQDGKLVCGAAPGQVVPIKGALLWNKTLVTITGFAADGSYVGTDSWTYEFGRPEVWSVHRLNRPQSSR